MALIGHGHDFFNLYHSLTLEGHTVTGIVFLFYTFGVFGVFAFQFITVVFFVDALRVRQSRVPPQGTSAQRSSHSLHTASHFAELTLARARESVFSMPRQ